MSRVSSDEQRIKEMNEAQLRKKKDIDKKDQKTRTEKSFDQVMTEKSQREKAQRLGQKKLAKEAGKEKAKTEQTTQKVLQRLPRDAKEVKKRAALFQASNQGQNAKRASLAEGAKDAEANRTVGLVEQAETEREVHETEVLKDELKEAVQESEQFYEVRLDQDIQGQQQPVERDKGQRGDGGQQSGGDDGGAKSVEKKGGAGGAGKLSPELIERLVGAIYTATQVDGRSEVVVQLKGAMLDGVTLRVQASKRGKIRCTFEGCDKQTKNLIEASKGELMRGLARKGLDLDILRVR